MNQNTFTNLLNSFLTNLPLWIGSKGSILIHTLFFIGIFSLQYIGVDYNTIMLILTTLVSLEAIYLSIFIQMSVNVSNTQVMNMQDEIQNDIEDVDKDLDTIEESITKNNNLTLTNEFKELQVTLENIQQHLKLLHKEMQNKTIQ
jgi:hypothetical protein